MSCKDYQPIVDDFVAAISPYVVSIGSGYPNKSEKLPPPDGSGTLVKFRTKRGVVYGVLTAAHVARWLECKDKSYFVGCSKIKNSKVLACSVNFLFIHFNADKYQFHNEFGGGYFPDLAFIALSLNKIPNHPLFLESEFYDLDSNEEFGYEFDEKIFSGYYRGACPKDEYDSFGNAQITFCIGGEEQIGHENNVHFWKIPNKDGRTIKGASGAGFFRCRYEGQGKDRLLVISLDGVIVSESLSEGMVFAIAGSYLFEVYLPSLKEFCASEVESSL